MVSFNPPDNFPKGCERSFKLGDYAVLFRTKPSRWVKDPPLIAHYEWRQEYRPLACGQWESDDGYYWMHKDCAAKGGLFW